MQESSPMNLHSLKIEDRCGVHEGTLISTLGCSRYGKIVIDEVEAKAGRHAVSGVYFRESQILMVGFNVLADPTTLSGLGVGIKSFHRGGGSGVVAYLVNKESGQATPFASTRLDMTRIEVNPSVSCRGKSSATQAIAYFAGQTAPGTIYRVSWYSGSSQSTLRVTGVLDLDDGDDKVYSLT